MFTRLLIRFIAIGMALFHVYAGYAGTFYPFVQRSVPVLICMMLAFLTVRSGERHYELKSDKASSESVPIYDWVLAVLCIPVFGYVTYNSTYLMERWPMTLSFAPTTLELTFAVLAILLLLEASRRVMGWLLVIVALSALLYSYLGEYIPIPALSHRPFTLENILDHMYLSEHGIWGIAVGVAATYIVLFIILGAFAEKMGTSKFFIDFAISLAGHTRGGPAKVAVVSSGMIGSVTGSTVANVYTTGQFTIPLMKRLGYRPSSAGAIEALASNGGQIMPPVLGAAAFLLASYTGVPYAKIALASLIPALLYFGGLFWFIHLEAHKNGLVGIPKEEKPSAIGVFLKGGHLLSPLVVLIICLVQGLSPIRAAFYAILFSIVISWVRKETRLGPKEILGALEAGAKNAVLIFLTCAVVGFVIGAFTLTGVGLNVSSAIISWSGGYFFATLVMVGVSCIVLGMGMNTVAAFILVSVVGVPALMTLGVESLVAHMFVFYFALLSHITPPVCLAIFAAADVARASIWGTALAGMKMGLVAYLLPFLVVYTPSLLLLGSPGEILINVISVSAGLLFLIAAVQGWLLNRLAWDERALFLASGLGLIWSDSTVKLVGLVLGVVVLALTLVRKGLRQSKCR